MATTVASRVERVRRYLGTTRRTLNRLAAGITASDTSLTLALPNKGVSLGSVLAIDDELLHVWDVSSTTVDVERGFGGTTAAVHAINAVIEVDARFPRVDIKDALREEIDSWPVTLFTVTTATLTASLTSRAIDLALGGNQFYFVIDVRREPYPGERTWVAVEGRVERNLPTADFASGSALFVYDLPEQTRRLQVTYAKPFSTTVFTDATDLEATVGLAPYMVDIPVFGAAWRLLAGQEAERSNMRRQGEPRTAEEVPPGFALSTAAGMQKLRDKRISEAAERLRAQYPIRF